MPKTFSQMAADAMAEIPGISPVEARRRLSADPNALLIDVLDLADREVMGQPEGATAISAGMLPLRADAELPAPFSDQRLTDRGRQLITICGMGPMGACSAKLLKDMGFTNVAYVDGGRSAWAEAGLPMEQPHDDPALVLGNQLKAMSEG